MSYDGVVRLMDLLVADPDRAVVISASIVAAVWFAIPSISSCGEARALSVFVVEAQVRVSIPDVGVEVTEGPARISGPDDGYAIELEMHRLDRQFRGCVEQVQIVEQEVELSLLILPDAIWLGSSPMHEFIEPAARW